MSPFGNNGNIRQQDVAARNVARQTIAQSLAREAQTTAVLVSSLVGRILDSQDGKRPVEELWNEVQNNPQLNTIKSRADVNAADYPEFGNWVASQRHAIARSQKKRIEQVVGPVEDQSRFANTVGLHS